MDNINPNIVLNVSRQILLLAIDHVVPICVTQFKIQYNLFNIAVLAFKPGFISVCSIGLFQGKITLDSMSDTIRPIDVKLV